MSLSKSEKLEYFSRNIESIFNSKQNQLVNFILELKSIDQVEAAFNDWPIFIKCLIVDKYLLSLGSED